MPGITSAFHEPQGLWYHGGALLYGLGGYALGLAGLFSDSLWVNAGAVALLGHAMTICAYMIHECGHNTVFRSNAANARLGRVRHLRGYPVQALPPSHG
jgi:fatty acid desaturase